MTPETSRDAVLGGRLTLRQPRRGHRVGHDAILLAAAVNARAGQAAADLGAGVGAAGLALAHRVDGVRVTLVENDPALVALATENIHANGLQDRVSAVDLDIAAPARIFTAAGLSAGALDHVLMNPPFNDPARQQSSPDRRRRAAHVADPATLATWIKAANRLLQPSGTLTLIYRADALSEVLDALAAFGSVAIMPVHPNPASPAIRVLVRAVKGGKAPLSLLPGLVLAGADNKPTPEAEAVLRGAESLQAFS